jgi:hypothetical protein
VVVVVVVVIAAVIQKKTKIRVTNMYYEYVLNLCNWIPLRA